MGIATVPVSIGIAESLLFSCFRTGNRYCENGRLITTIEGIPKDAVLVDIYFDRRGGQTPELRFVFQHASFEGNDKIATITLHSELL